MGDMPNAVQENKLGVGNRRMEIMSAGEREKAISRSPDNRCGDLHLRQQGVEFFLRIISLDKIGVGRHLRGAHNGIEQEAGEREFGTPYMLHRTSGCLAVFREGRMRRVASQASTVE